MVAVLENIWFGILYQQHSQIKRILLKKKKAQNTKRKILKKKKKKSNHDCEGDDVATPEE
jgi:hypothetical protein